MIGVPSLIGCGIEDLAPSLHQHNREWYEVDANNLANDYFGERGMTNATAHFGPGTSHPLDFNPDWFTIVTALYYCSFCLL